MVDVFTSELNPTTRAAVLGRLDDTSYDVLVIGGGVTGAGVALDAVTRGLRVALVEKRDWAAGTSSRSGKLIHGGLRYLEQLDFGLVREALKERRLFLKRLCPHLAKPIQFIYPLKHRVWERAYMGSGLALYDTMGGAGAVPMHGHLGQSRILEMAPGLEPGELVGGLTFYDVQIDDARHTCELVRTAAARGADVLSAMVVDNLVVEDVNGVATVRGAEVTDAESGTRHTIRASVVVNATGVWSDQIRRMAPGSPSFSVRASKGIHITVPRDRIDSTISIFVRAEDSVIFVRTWGDHWLIGTTDTTWSQGLDHPAATSEDIEYLLRNVNRVLRRPLSVDDIDGVYSGLRPLVTEEDVTTNSKLSREHALDIIPGLVTIAGGKYTTYRVMAQDVVDEVSKQLGVDAPCLTQKVRLLGAQALGTTSGAVTALARRIGLTDEQIEHLLGRYGSLTGELLGLIQENPELAQPVPGAERYLLAEARYAVTHEGALHLDDVITRRTRIAIETHHRGLDSAAAIARVMADYLGWTPEQEEAELAHYRERVRVERAAERESTDAGAAAVRETVKDLRLA